MARRKRKVEEEADDGLQDEVQEEAKVEKVATEEPVVYEPGQGSKPDWMK